MFTEDRVDANYGKYDPASSPVWKAYYCINNVINGTTQQAMENGRRGSDVVQCVDICLCTAINAVCVVINVYLLAFTIKSQGLGKAVKHVRFWIFCTGQVMVVCLLVTDIFNLADANYTLRRAISLGAWTLRCVVLILLCIYFFRRSRKLVLPDDAVRIRKVQYVSWGAWGCAYVALSVAGVAETQGHTDFVTCSNLDVIVCESVIPILFDTLGLCIYITMAGIAFMIKRAMQRA